MIRAEIIHVAAYPPMVLRDGLRLRQPSYEFDEDGFSLSGDIWRWRGHVNPHTDDLGMDELVIGYVLDAGSPHGKHTLVHGDQALPLEPGTIYLLDPHVRHGVLGPDHTAVLTCYIGSRKIVDRYRINWDKFAEEALKAAWALVQSLPPDNEEYLA